MIYDEILTKIGECGPYQRLVCTLLCLPGALVGVVLMSSVFILTEPPHRCAIPELTNDTYSVQSDFHHHLINRTIAPAEADGENDDEQDSYSNCYIYSDANFSDVGGEGNTLHWNGTSLTKCQEWVYDPSDFTRSILTEFNLVCGKIVMRAHSNTGMFVGGFAGALLFGILADWIGRRKTCLICLCVQLVSGIALYFVPSLVGVIVMRAIQGTWFQAFAIAASICMELVGPSRRTVAGLGIEFSWLLGEYIVLGLAFVIRDWRLLELVMAMMALPLIILFCFLPESPRWLLDKGRYSQAKQILEKIAKANETELPLGAVNETTVEEGERVPLSSLLKHKVLVFRSLIIGYIWYTVNLLFYGLALNLDNLVGDPYINFFISVTLEGLAYCLCFILLDRTGRKRLFIASILIGGVACITVIFPVMFGSKDDQWTTTALALIGRTAASSCYCILYIMTVELFPTVVRNSALAVCITIESIAGITAPYIADLGKIVGGSLSQALPSIVFGLLSLLGGLLSLYLPETLNKPLPETLEDAIKFASEPKRSEKTVNVSERHDVIRNTVV